MASLSVFVLTPDFPPSPEFPMLNGAFDESVARARRLGYDGVELTVGDPDRIDPSAIEATLARHQMKISAINSGGLQYVLQLALVSQDAGVERRAFEKLRTIIRLAARLRCLTQVGVSRGFALKHRPIREFRWRLVETLKRACDIAGELDSRIVLEYTNRFEINSLNSGPEAREVIQRVGRPNLGLLLDTHHSWLEDNDIGEEIRLSGPLLRHVHLHNSDYRSPGVSQGELDFNSVFAALASIGYQGFLSDGLFAASMADEEIRRSIAFIRDLAETYGLPR